MPNPPHEQAPTRQDSFVQDDLPTADSLFGGNTSLLPQLGSRPLSGGAFNQSHIATASSIRPPFNPPPQIRPQQQQHQQQHQPYQHVHQRPPQHPTGRPLSPLLQQQPRQTQYRPQRPPMQQQQQPHQQQQRQQQQQQQQQPQRLQHQLHKQQSILQGDRAISPVQNPRALPPSPVQDRSTANSPLPPRSEYLSSSSANQTNQSKDFRDSQGFSNPMPAPTSEKDALPSADVLFGGSSSFDLFSPAPSMPQRLPVQQPKFIQPKETLEQPKTPLHSFKQHEAEHNEGKAASATSSLYSSPSIPTANQSISQEHEEGHEVDRESAYVSQWPDTKSTTLSSRESQDSASHSETLQQIRKQISHREGPSSSHVTENDDGDKRTASLESAKQDSMPNNTLNFGSSSLFAGSTEMDASQLFFGTSPVDPNSFFTGFSQESQAMASKEQYALETSTLFSVPFPNHQVSKVTEQLASTFQTTLKTNLRESQEMDVKASVTTAPVSTSAPADMDTVFNTSIQDQVINSEERKQEPLLSWEPMRQQNLSMPHIDIKHVVALEPESAQETVNQKLEHGSRPKESTEADLHETQYCVPDHDEHPQEKQHYTVEDSQPRHEHPETHHEHSHTCHEHSQPDHDHPEQPYHGLPQPHRDYQKESDDHSESRQQFNSHQQCQSDFSQLHNEHHQNGEYGFIHGQAQPRLRTVTSQRQEGPLHSSVSDFFSTSTHMDHILAPQLAHAYGPTPLNQGSPQIISNHLQQSRTSDTHTTSIKWDSSLPIQTSINNEIKPHDLSSGVLTKTNMDHEPRSQNPPSDDQPIPFDTTPSGPSSPVFDREVMGAFDPQGIHGSGSTGQPGSYSILELGSELAQSPYFSQARQSPLIQEHYVLRKSSISPSDTSQWKKHQIETEESTFDHVSLTEDAAGSTAGVPSVSSPPRERGLASLLDPSTLSAVEDLLNMPKSAAFERGMSRLFKGVKSSATSIFASPLSQVQPKVSGEEKDDGGPGEPCPIDATHQAFDGTNPEHSHALSDLSNAPVITPQHLENVALPKTTVSTQSPLSPSIPPPPKGPKRNSASILPARSTKVKSPTQQYPLDWAHKQSTPFAEVSEHTAQETADTVAILNAGEYPATQTGAELESDKDGYDFNEQGATEPEPALSTRDSQEEKMQETSEIRLETDKQLSSILLQSSPNVPDTANNSKVDDFRPAQRKDQSSRPFSPDNSKLALPSQVNPELQRPLSPSVLDREAILRKQAAVTALRAEHTGVGVVRANNDKKAKLLEKARDLREKRQQQAGHRSPLLLAHSGSFTQTSPLLESRRSSSDAYSERIRRTGSISSAGSNRASVDLVSEQRQNHDQHSSSLIFTSSYQSDADRNPAYSSSSTSRELGVTQHPPLAGHAFSAENDQLKQQLQLLRTEVETLRMNRVLSSQLNSQLEQELRDELSTMQTELNMSSTAFNESSLSHSQQMSDLTKENQRLQEELVCLQKSAINQESHSNLANKCQHLEAELEQSRRIYPEYQATLSELERLSSVYEENQRLRQELQRTQYSFQNYISERSQTTISLDDEVFSPEQLSKEAEGLRRQLKGQREEMKELQESVKRSELEKRELFSKVEHLERLLADAEKHRNELKSHQAMKDEAYKVIQERLVTSFEEEKAQYIDEEAFKMVKLEHRYSLLQEEFQSLQAESKKRQEELEQAQLTSQGTVFSLQERVKQLDVELTTKYDLATKHEIRASELGAAYEESKKREEQLVASLTLLEDRTALLQRDLAEAAKYHTDNYSSTEIVEAPKLAEQSSRLDSLTFELDQALGREQGLRKELEMMLQTNAQTTHSGEDGREVEPTSQHIEYDRLAGQASKWQEECLMAQEEKMRVEDQLQRVEMELIAAKTEINQLEASLGAEPDAHNSGKNQLQLEQDLEEAKRELQRLTRQLEERDVAMSNLELSRERNYSAETAFLEQKQALNSRISDLAQQLEDQRSECLRLGRELEEAKSGHAASKARDVDEALNIQTLLEKERRAKKQMTDDLEGQLQRVKEMLLEKQKEVEQMTLELDNMTYKSAAMERDFAQLQGYRGDALKERDNSAESVAVLQKQLYEVTRDHDNTVAENSEREAGLKKAISTLENKKQELEQQLRLQVDSAERYKDETHILQQSVQRLQKELFSVTEKASSEEKLETSLSNQSFQLEGQISALQNDYKQAQEQVKLVVDLFGKLLRSSEEPEELSALETTIVSVLAGIKPLGVPVQSLPQVCVRFIELQRVEAGNRSRLRELEIELQDLKLSNHDKGRRQTNDTSKELLTEHAANHDIEVQELQQKLVRTEHGITKLQQFLQEFQNEKKMAIYELQQRLQDSEKEVGQVRSQLAKAQAMLMAKSSDPATPTQGAFLLASMSPTQSRSQSPHQEIQQTLQQQQPQQQEQSRKASLDNNRALLSDEMFETTEQIRHEAVLALEPLRLQKIELERTLLDLRHRYELSQKENDSLLSTLEKENQQLRAKAERMSPDMSSEHLERIRELELELMELTRQLKTAQREREFARQDMRTFKAELAKLKARN
ncbi:hypothetical protein BGX27_004460 [Mortierella sp. AM989]|nr:hypothetical protein BGX27_004460 [Mortierella sp. AM989]